MALVDGSFAVWGVAGGFTTLALATGGRAIFGQWRSLKTSNRQADAWTDITEAAARLFSGDVAAAKSVANSLSRSSTQRIAVEALASLARIDSRVALQLRGQTEIVKHLRSWVLRELAHGDPGRRAGAAEIVGALRLRNCRGPVALATSDDDSSVRVAACRALAVVEPDHAIGVLLGLVERDGAWAADLLADLVSRKNGSLSGSDAVVQRANEWAATPALLRLLSNGRIAGAERVMLGALDAKDDQVRANAAEAMRENASPEATSALLGLLSDPKETIRLSAVRAIGRMDDATYALDLAAMLGDGSRLVRFAAGAALSKIPGGPAILLRATQGSDPLAIEAAHVSLWQAEQIAAADPAASTQVDPESDTSFGLRGFQVVSAVEVEVDATPQNVRSVDLVPEAVLELRDVPSVLSMSLVPDWTTPEWLALESTFTDPEDLSWERLIWGDLFDDRRNEVVSPLQQRPPHRQLFEVPDRTAELRDLSESDELCAS